MTDMNLGFVSAIFPELALGEVLRFAKDSGYECVEVMCWPSGKAERRYAGVTHINATEPNLPAIKALVDQHGVAISGLGYYPNPLCANEKEAHAYITHLKAVITAAQKLGLTQVNTFVGREHTLSVSDNWALFDARWPAIVAHAEACNVRIGIENCPMLFTKDEWPGGKNLAVSPAIWREMFRRIPSGHFGLNYDPSHLIWQGMDPVQPIYEFRDRIFHVHAKDARVYGERLNAVGILATPLEYHSPKLPGLGDVPWGRFFAALTDIKYRGPLCVEVEDRAYEGFLEDRQRALHQSKRFLEQFL